jgi:hypothetical protein
MNRNKPIEEQIREEVIESLLMKAFNCSSPILDTMINLSINVDTQLEGQFHFLSGLLYELKEMEMTHENILKAELDSLSNILDFKILSLHIGMFDIKLEIEVSKKKMKNLKKILRTLFKGTSIKYELLTPNSELPQELQTAI